MNSLTQEQFNYIVEQSDAILRKYASNKWVTGIACLHVLNSHPANQSKYLRVFYKYSFLFSLQRFIFRTGQIVWDLFRPLSSANEITYENISPDTKVLILSHIASASTKEEDPDFYFQELPEYLQGNNHSTAVVFLNYPKNFKMWTNQSQSLQNKPFKCLLSQRLCVKTNFYIIIKLLATAALFFKESLSEKDPVKKKFLENIIINIFSAETLIAQRINFAVQKIINSTNISTIAFTWEGHSWERLICYAAKNNKRKLLSIGYQHAILFPQSHALKRSIGDAYDPDIILTTGSVTKNILISSFMSSNIIIQEYGSPRLANVKKYMPIKPLEESCLVAPEGLIGESVRLFLFALEAAKLRPSIQFVFRTHPSLPLSDLEQRDDRLKNLPANVVVSFYKNIDNDFNRCSWVLYRSSSVVFFAIKSGLRPLYLQLENELSIDPLYKLDTWRKNIRRASELIHIIEIDQKMAEKERVNEINRAIIFSESYMAPYNLSIFEKHILENDFQKMSKTIRI